MLYYDNLFATNEEMIKSITNNSITRDELLKNAFDKLTDSDKAQLYLISVRGKDASIFMHTVAQINNNKEICKNIHNKADDLLSYYENKQLKCVTLKETNNIERYVSCEVCFTCSIYFSNEIDANNENSTNYRYKPNDTYNIKAEREVKETIQLYYYQIGLDK